MYLQGKQKNEAVRLNTCEIENIGLAKDNEHLQHEVAELKSDLKSASKAASEAGKRVAKLEVQLEVYQSFDDKVKQD